MTARSSTLDAGEQAVVLQAASICLSYPDGTVREMLPLVRGAVDGLPAGRPRERLTAFLHHVADTPPGRLADLVVGRRDPPPRWLARGAEAALPGRRRRA
jgi:nitrate reductase delta subunit